MKQILVAVFLLITFASCQKEVEDQVTITDNCLLMRMVQGLNNSPLGDTTFEFIYNDTGRLEEITYAMDDFPFPYPLELKYDDQGRLMKVEEPLNPGGSLESSFSYDNEGRLSEFIYRRFAYPSKFVYTYGPGSKPEMVTDYDYIGGQWQEQAIYRYTYANGNVIKRDFYLNGMYKWSQTYEYDLNIPNNTGLLPLVGFSSLPLGFDEEFFYFNKNLPKKKSWEDGTDYVYEYGLTDGRITQSVGTYLNHGISSQKDTRTYFYECK